VGNGRWLVSVLAVAGTAAVALSQQPADSARRARPAARPAAATDKLVVYKSPT